MLVASTTDLLGTGLSTPVDVVAPSSETDVWPTLFALGDDVGVAWTSTRSGDPYGDVATTWLDLAPATRPHEALELLAETDPDRLTPREALQLLYDLKSKL